MPEPRPVHNSWQPTNRASEGRPAPRLWRSSSNRVVAGVLGGLAERFNLESLPLRILFALFTLGTGGLLAIIYVVLWAITREGYGPASPASRFRRSRSSRVIAGVLGGLAERSSFDATVIRILFVLISVLSAAFPGILVYLVLWMFSESPDATDA